MIQETTGSEEYALLPERGKGDNEEGEGSETEIRMKTTA